MPVSRKRKLSRGQKVKGAVKRAALYVKNRAAVLPIYERALPYKQAYPPFILTALKKQPAPDPKIEETPARHAPGSVVTLSSGRQYKVQGDGSWRRYKAESGPQPTESR
jgi:hypothetical protein